MDKIANYSEINSLLLNVSEKISKENINEFIKTSLELNYIDAKDKNIFYIFLEDSLKYQILYCNNKYEFLEPELFNYFDDFSNTYDLFRYEKYFVVFKASKFYYYQKLDGNILDEELKEYLYKSLNIKISKFINISKDDYERLYLKYENLKQKSLLKSFNVKSNKALYIYLLYLVITISSLFLYLFYEQKQKENELKLFSVTQQKNLEELKKKYLYKPLFPYLEVLIKKLNKYKLELVKIEYKKEKISLELKSKNKEKLYMFLEQYNKNILNSSLVYDEIEKIFWCKIDVKLSK